MDTHPASVTLESFLLGRLAWDEMKNVVIHLLRGCDRCREEMEPTAMAILSSRWPKRDPSPEEDAAYDAAISEACRRVLETLRKDKKAVGRQALEHIRRGRESALTVGRV
ncbi:MAG TPA: hypothetical protein VE685_02930 [Thermoanaerobaculia bacterium]|nr:hypothetical protein [Thermoanaerobaculia bacterium]